MPRHIPRHRHKRQANRPLSPAESAFSSFLSAAASKASELAQPARPTPLTTVPPAPPAVTPPVIPTTSSTPVTTMPATKPPAKPATKSKAPASTKSAKATSKAIAGAHKGPSPAVIGVVVTICVLVALGVGAFFLRKYLIKKRKQKREEMWTNRPRTTFINTDKPGGLEEEIEPYTDRLKNQRDSANTSEHMGDAFGGPQTGVPYYAEKALPSPDTNHDLQVLSYNSPAPSTPATPLNEKAPTLTLGVHDEPSTGAPTSLAAETLATRESQLFFTEPMKPDAPKTLAGYALPTSPPPVYNSPTAELGSSLPNPHPPVSSAVPAALLPGGVQRDSLRPASPAAAPLALPTMQGQRQGTEATMPTYTLPAETAPGPTQPTTDPAPIPTGASAAGSPPAASYAYTVIRTFAPTLPDELRITTGERVKILNSYDDGWALCENIGGQKGVVPLECLDLNLTGSSSNEEWRISRRASSLFGVTVNF